jgi:hypothetical protein
MLHDKQRANDRECKLYSILSFLQFNQINFLPFSDMRKIFPFGLFHLGGDEVYTG